MRLVKLVLVSVCLLFVVVTLLGLLFPSQVVVSRAVNVKTNAAKIDSLVLHPLSWFTWMPGTQGVSIIVNNRSLTANISTQKIIVESINQQQVKANWVGQKTMQQMELNIFRGNNETTVQWQFTEKIGWLPWQRFGSMLNEKLLGPTMEQGLEKLKLLLE